MGLHIRIEGQVQGFTQRMSKANKPFYVVDFAQTVPRIGQENLFSDDEPPTGPCVAVCEFTGGSLRLQRFEGVRK